MTRVTHVGFMSIERWWDFWREIEACVLCNGIDITNNCRWFDDQTGQAECLVRDETGAAQLVGGYDRVLTEVLTGRIEVMVP